MNLEFIPEHKPTGAKAPPANLRAYADALGVTRARIRALKDRETELAKTIRDSGIEVIEGRRFRVSVKRRTQESLDTKNLRLELPRDLWEDFLRVAEQVRLEVSPLA
jgi:hypothetical protein